MGSSFANLASTLSSGFADHQADFQHDGEDYELLAKKVELPYGLTWGVCAVLSLTELFSEINAAATRMLAYTAVAIAVLAVSAGLLISYFVTAPLARLCHQACEERGVVARPLWVLGVGDDERCPLVTHRCRKCTTGYSTRLR